MKTHTVEAGDCILSIATANGHFWETLWNHPGNAKLKALRKDPFQLVAGDKVQVPEAQERPLFGSTGHRHLIKIKGIPAHVQFQVFSAGTEPFADAPFTLEVAGKKVSGTTTSDGIVSAFVPADAKDAKLTVGAGEDKIELEIAIGGLDPSTELTGVQSRLANLGFYGGDLDGKESDALTEALTSFQEASGLETTGKADPATVAALDMQHG